jgi:hypothetical protein
MTTSLSQSLGGGDPVAWARDFLAAAGFPLTASNIAVVYSWEYAESGGGGGMWNPLNTTQGGYAGESDFNSVGVKNYAQRADGIAANARVIHNGYYPAAVAQFTAGDDANATIHAITTSPWGTRVIVLRTPPGAPIPPPPHPAPSTQEIDPMIFLAPQWQWHDPNRPAIAIVDLAAKKVTLGNAAQVNETNYLNIPSHGPLIGATATPDGFAAFAEHDASGYAWFHYTWTKQP